MELPKPWPRERYQPWLDQTGVPLRGEPRFLMFGDSPALARELAELVACGAKRATAGVPAAWTTCGDPLPRVGQVFIVHDWGGTPYALAEYTEVETKPLSAVDAAFAYDEGEGDRTLAWWKRAHEAYFARACPRFGLTFAWDMPVIFQRFRRLFPAEDATR